MAVNEHVVSFWRPLKKLVRERDVNYQKLASRLGLSVPAVSEMLSGKRAKAPSWDAVRTVVSACFEGAGPETGRIKDELRFWRRRLDELVTTLEAEKPARKPKAEETAVASARCRICSDAYEHERFALPDETFEFWDFSFVDAVVLLAGPDSELRSAAEGLALHRIEEANDLDAFRDHCRDVTDALLGGIGGTVRQACHQHRVRLLHAAHTVVVVESFLRSSVLDMLLGSGRAFDVDDIIAVTYADGKLAAAPMPVADVSYTDHRVRVTQHYAEAVAAVTWSGPDSSADRHAALGAEAEELYGIRLGELASECPELFVWASLQDGTHAIEMSSAVSDSEGRRKLEALARGLREQKRGLSGLQTLLTALARKAEPSAWPAKLSSIYRRELARPISPIADTPHDGSRPEIPKLAQGYVNPAFRCSVYRAGDQPHVDEWWRMRPLRDEIQGFLAGYLSGLPVVQRPVIIFGDPGAGKSLLTRMLAARLPASDYLPVRIELRNVPADGEVLDQIAYALRAATQKRADWVEVVEESPDVLPVLIFDGFDELLQAGGADHWRYLEEIEEFQQTSANNGRPVAAIVTSRTVVADQAKIPDGCLLMRLEPFDAERIELWVDTWNEKNRERFARCRIEPLPSGMGERHPGLAAQPLLLLMLALYYAVESGGGSDAIIRLSRVELYEKIMQLFVRRQVEKLEPGLTPDVMEAKVEAELDHLSIIAAAMFNRGRQGVSAEEADHDLGFLRDPENPAKLSPARMLFGRFFFIHEARATFGGREDHRWYEFLHATFGEYLVARKVAAILRHCPDGGPYEELLFGLLSFSPLTDRVQILSDLRELLTSTEMIPGMFRGALLARPARGAEYTTGPVAITYRHACFSVNLLLVELAVRGTVRFSVLTGSTADRPRAWRDHATLWQSQLAPTSWDAFTRAVTCTSFAAGEQQTRDVAVRLVQQDGRHGETSESGADASAERGQVPARRWGSVAADERLRRVRMLGDDDMSAVTQMASVAYEDFGNVSVTAVLDRDGVLYSPERTLMSLVTCDRTAHQELARRYSSCLAVVEAATDERYVRILARRLTQDCAVLEPSVGEAVLSALTADAATVDRMSHAVRTDLLACALHEVRNSRSTKAATAAFALIGLDLLKAPVDGPPGALFTWMLDTAERRRPKRSEKSELAVLLLAVDQEQFDWADRFADKILSSVSDETLDGMPAAYVESLLLSLPKCPATAERVLRAAEGPV
ncbi:NACHT domain-containing protein [Streptomyces sp. NPDC021093]|uniref:NACHT domain-containing protein n=1 Tax=Streptomyces sp. NPDC021093 TaxID=3365112 RepID=UPI0037985B51